MQALGPEQQYCMMQCATQMVNDNDNDNEITSVPANRLSRPLNPTQAQQVCWPTISTTQPHNITVNLLLH